MTVELDWSVGSKEQHFERSAANSSMARIQSLGHDSASRGTFSQTSLIWRREEVEKVIRPSSLLRDYER